MRGINRVKLVAFGCTALLALAVTAQTPGKLLEPVNMTYKLGEQSVEVSIDPKIRVEGADPTKPILLRFGAEVDLTDLQRKLPEELNGPKKHEECGDRLSISGTRLNPGPGGTAIVTAQVHGARWECRKFEIPELRCNGVFDCKVEMKVQTAKTELIKQSADLQISLLPEPVGVAVRLRATVVQARPDGTLGELVERFGWEEEVIALAQSELDKALQERPLSVALPHGLGRYVKHIESTKFYDAGNDRLGLRLSGTSELTDEELLGLVVQGVLAP